MSSEALTRPTRARATRAQEDARRRRRRDPNDTSVVKRLSVPEEFLDRGQFQYRWVVDQTDRIKMLERQDWDRVGDDELGGESPTRRHADVAQNRLPLETVLMRKYKDWFDADHAANQKRLDDEMKAAELGKKVLSGPDNGEGLDAADPRVYSPLAAQANKLT